MNKERTLIKIAKYLAIGTVLSILVFFSVSFITYLADLDTFNPAAGKELNVDIGFPFTYYTEDLVGREKIPATWAKGILLIADCAITWMLVAIPYTVFKVKRKNPKGNQLSEIIDQETA